VKRAVGAFAAMMMVSVGNCPLAGYAEQGDPDEVVASVDGVKCLRKDMDLFVANILASQNVPAAQQAEARKHFEKSFVNSFVMRTLLTNEAAKEGVTVTDEDRKAQEERLDAVFKPMNKTREQYFKESPFGEETARKEFEHTMLIEKLLRMKVVDLIAIDAAEVEKAIEAVKANNAAVEAAVKNEAETKAAKRAKIEDIKKQLAAGADFAALAKEHSDCPSGQRGGDLGTFQRGQMVKPFEDAAFTQEVGKVGDIVETQFGYHLILVTAKNPAVAADGTEPAKPETVAASHILVKTGNPQQAVQPVPTADEIRERLKQQKAQPATRAYLNELKGKAKIESVIPIDSI
jgi:peptidyl-prolyl cis-trans isomerase C